MITLPISADRPTTTATLPDGTSLKLLPCKKSLINRIFNIKSSLTVIDEIYAVTADVLSCNTDNRVIAVADIDDWDTDIVFGIYKAYIKFMVKLLNSPN